MIYYHTQFKNRTLHGASADPTSEAVNFKI
jgi:hypothetical protein